MGGIQQKKVGGEWDPKSRGRGWLGAGRGSSLQWSRGKRERMCRCTRAHSFGKEGIEECLFGSSDFTSGKEKVTFKGGRSRDRGVVGSLRSLRKWAEAKKAAHWPGLFYEDCTSFCKKFSNKVTKMEFNFT